VTAYHVIHHQFELDRIARELFPVDSSKRRILLTVMAASVQRLVLDHRVPQAERSNGRMAPEQVITISRRSIAAATGLPRETVRRHVKGMLDQGFLLPQRDGVIINLLASDDRAINGTIAIAEAATAMAQQLFRLGVLCASGAECD
jgi:hypothetical protein